MCELSRCSSWVLSPACIELNVLDLCPICGWLFYTSNFLLYLFVQAANSESCYWEIVLLLFIQAVAGWKQTCHFSLIATVKSIRSKHRQIGPLPMQIIHGRLCRDFMVTVSQACTSCWSKFTLRHDSLIHFPIAYVTPHGISFSFTKFRFLVWRKHVHVPLPSCFCLQCSRLVWWWLVKSYQGRVIQQSKNSGMRSFGNEYLLCPSVLWINLPH